MPAVKQTKAYLSFLLVFSSEDTNELEVLTVKAASMNDAQKQAAERLKNNDFTTLDAYSVVDNPSAYSVEIYELAAPGQKFEVKSAGIVLEKVGV